MYTHWLLSRVTDVWSLGPFRICVAQRLGPRLSCLCHLVHRELPQCPCPISCLYRAHSLIGGRGAGQGLRERRAFISDGALCPAFCSVPSACPAVSSWPLDRLFSRCITHQDKTLAWPTFMLKCIQMDQRLTCKTETGRPLEENVGEKIFDISLGNFFSWAPKTQVTKPKMNQ